MTLRTRGTHLQNRFGILLQQLREERHLTRAQLAKLAGLSASYVNSLESGTNMPTLGVA
jgi:transcriptional regulator with XRE-family HTH domain